MFSTSLHLLMLFYSWEQNATTESEADQVYRTNPVLKYSKIPLKAPLLPLPYGQSQSSRKLNLDRNIAAVILNRVFKDYYKAKTSWQLLKIVCTSNRIYENFQNCELSHVTGDKPIETHAVIGRYAKTSNRLASVLESYGAELFILRSNWLKIQHFYFPWLNTSMKNVLDQSRSLANKCL